MNSAIPITVGFAGFSGPSATWVSIQWTPAITTYVSYDGQLGHGNYDSNAVTGGLRFSF